MKIKKIRRDQCSLADDVVVVIDVIKAFTTAAFAFHKGADKIIVVGPIDEAFLLREHSPHYELIGEAAGLRIEGFHYDNSPTEASAQDFKGKTLVMRTSSGTQGVVNCSSAAHILASSFVVANATVKRIRELNPKSVTFVITGTHGEEDFALADYLESCLLHSSVPPEPFLERVKTSFHGSLALTRPSYPNCSKIDLEAALEINRFNFALEVKKEHSQFVMRPYSYD
ncbi:putative 2-phosphosulfolactate phosphatase [Chlamydiales bacterium STE3]|nr:putative 2-phosphosulfolactate phosphatase [Chlamydiales bacterium STE3]